MAKSKETYAPSVLKKRRERFFRTRVRVKAIKYVIICALANQKYSLMTTKSPIIIIAITNNI
jgi:ribosomal protein L34